jgi:hypothetical protein
VWAVVDTGSAGTGLAAADMGSAAKAAGIADIVEVDMEVIGIFLTTSRILKCIDKNGTRIGESI